MGFLLRFIGLSKFPYGFTPDEASFGYDAYSLYSTGKDQWGHPWPLVLESFGDFKAPLYSYLAIPFIWVFGISKFAIRLPNALLGTAAIYVVFLLTSQFMKEFKLEIGNWKLEIITAALLAISPWHVMMSRGAFEANLTTFFLPLGIYLFLKGIQNTESTKHTGSGIQLKSINKDHSPGVKKRNKYLLLSALIFGLNLFSYHSAKLVTPLVVGSLLILYRNQLKFITMKARIYSSILFLIFLLLGAYSFKLGAGTRAKDISIFANAQVEAAGDRLTEIEAGAPFTLAKLTHNKFQLAIRKFVSNYLTYFSPNFLLFQGPSETTYGMIPGRGVIYWFEAVLLLGFILYLAKRKIAKEVKLVVIWLLAAPIPAALSTGPGYAANRAVIMLPAVQIILAIGAFTIYTYYEILLKKIYFKFAVRMFFIISLIFFLSFIEDYFILSPKKTAQGMLWGNYEAIEWVSQNASEKSNVLVSRSLSEPHIYYAFVSEYNPHNYQKESESWNYSDMGLSWVDQLPTYKLGNFYFESIDEDKLKNKAFEYVVGYPQEFPENTIPEKSFKYPDGNNSVYVVKSTSQVYAAK